MSFIDTLKNNYDPNGDKARDQKAQALADSIVVTILATCQKVSASQRSVHGYYCTEYDGPEISENGRKTLFVYDTDFGKYKSAIEHFYGTPVTNNTYGRDVPGKIVPEIKRQLTEKGFVDPIVRADDTVERFKYDHTQFLAREKYAEFPAFSIYVDVNW